MINVKILVSAKMFRFLAAGGNEPVHVHYNIEFKNLEFIFYSGHFHYFRYLNNDSQTLGAGGIFSISF